MSLRAEQARRQRGRIDQVTEHHDRHPAHGGHTPASHQHKTENTPQPNTGAS